MAEYKTRIQQKHAPSTDWAKATNFTPLDGEIIIYTDLNKFKIGDGVTKVEALEFANSKDAETLTGASLSTILNSSDVEIPTSKAVLNALNGKVDKVDGKSLSTEDYTTEEKNKLSGIESGANKTTVDSSLSSTSTNPVQNKVINTKFTSVQSDIDTKQTKITASGILKGNGSGGVVAATRGSDYIASGNIVKQTLVESESTPTENYAINWVYG